MPYTVLGVQTAARSGTIPTRNANDAVNGNTFSNDGHTYLLLLNGSGADAAVVTIARPNTVDGGAIADLTIPLAFGVENIVGPLMTNVYNVQSGTDIGKVRLDYSGDGAASVTVAIFRGA